MTEIPMPSDYQPTQPPDKDKGCCERCCECWLYLLVAAIIIIALVFILFWGYFASLFGFTMP
ncbi:hypothetical protein EU524_00530 [Candidatus Thorarchaeota archaeon]|nr:MAG: hypothetical protein EU524_00530 [Candidatus Thorarchaeota archaeon]